MKDLISIQDLTRNQIEGIFTLTDRLKRKTPRSLNGRIIAMIFEKPSTRTRVSFEIAIYDLGGHPIYLPKKDIQLGRGETLGDTAKTLGEYVDGIVARLFTHKEMLDLAKYSSVPVINGLDDLLHPCQALSDLYTIKKRFKTLKGLKLAFLGDGGSNVCHSLMQACSKLGVRMSIACPREHSPRPKILKQSRNCRVVRKPEEAVRGSDIIYTDTWVSMGEEGERKSRLKRLRPYQVNPGLLKQVKKRRYFVMHCLPAHRGQEITGDILDGKKSIAWEQAHNRLHVQKAILHLLLAGKK
jgi:ornithine carbamoyltransferase